MGNVSSKLSPTTWILLIIIALIILWISSPKDRRYGVVGVREIIDERDSLYAGFEPKYIEQIKSNRFTELDTEILVPDPVTVRVKVRKGDKVDFTPKMPQYILKLAENLKGVPDPKPPYETVYSKVGKSGKRRIMESVGEQWCHHIMEELFGVPFRKEYPKWLKSRKKGQMELDVYAEIEYEEEIYIIALEFHGRNHFTPSFGNSIEQFVEACDRDNDKMKLCKEQGIPLIIVPYNVPRNDLYREFILMQIPEKYEKLLV